MAIGNTFGATALSSYGGFWIAFAIILTPGGFNIESTYLAATDGSPEMFLNALGLFLMVSFMARLPTPDSRRIESETNLYSGLVHLHLHPSSLHSALHRRIFLAVPLSGHRLLAPLHRLPGPHRRRTHCRHHQGRRLLCSARRLPCLVQCFGWYCRLEQQLLHHSCCSLPLVREGP